VNHRTIDSTRACSGSRQVRRWPRRGPSKCRDWFVVNPVQRRPGASEHHCVGTARMRPIEPRFRFREALSEPRHNLNSPSAGHTAPVSAIVGPCIPGSPI